MATIFVNAHDTEAVNHLCERIGETNYIWLRAGRAGNDEATKTGLLKIAKAITNAGAGNGVALDDFHLDLAGHGGIACTDECVRELGQALGTNTSINEFELRLTGSNPLSPDSKVLLEPLFDGLMLNSTLADFEFDSSMDDNEECRAVEKSVLSSLSRMLSKGDIPLDSLTVSCNCLDDSIAIESIVPSLKIATKLKSVVLGSRNQLTAAGVNAISNAMQEHGGKINLCMKWSSDDVIWDMINKCRGVESLTLERNEGNPNYKELESLTQEQIKGFSDNLIGAFSRRRSGISSLSLEGLRMNTHQFRYFVQALGRCSNLKDIRFDLSLDNGRADIIAEALLTSESLKAIGFGWNSRISDDEASALAALLKNNHHINQVRVDGRRGGFTERGVIAFLRAIQERSVAFRLINLSMDNLGSEGIQEIARVIKNPYVQLRRLQILTESRIDRSVAFDAYRRCLSLLASNNTLKILTLPLSFDRFSSEELDRLAGLAVGALQQNHTFRFIAPLTFEGPSAAQREAKRLLKANRKGPVAAPVLKGQPLHTKFISDMSDSVLPSAIARCNKLAKLDLVYAFVRQMNDAMVLRMDTGSGGKRKAG